ncbi:MAG: M48 family metallopeptidase [Bacteroidetes bacterium]|nr:M48 family metallopeptidase [Bacteroidota bacterium]MBS1974809.1 M48 family metallopeptidase [Bacteroidota bacterium]
MKKLLTAAALSIASGCTHNAITGRSQLILYPESEIQTMAAGQYKEFLTSNKVVTVASNKHDVDMVRRVGERISTAITAYYNQQGLGKELDGYHWEYNLVDSKEVNAWCMPGGKIVVYTGLLPITQSETALAIVLGHEITHALARHGNERLSQGMVQQLGGVALSVAVANKPAETQALFLDAYGIGSNVGVLLPFSRQQELEADRLGLRFAAMAGYDPREAIPFWQRMKAASGNNHPPLILSTHPLDDTRIAKLQEAMPDALKYYSPGK